MVEKGDKNIMTKVCVRQPGYLPYIGFFKKIESSDVFVFLDDIQYEKNGFDNRNKIRTSEGFMWLTVPVNYKFGQFLNKIKIANNEDFCRKHRKAIKINYQKAAFFSEYWNDIESILSQKWELLIDLNIKLIEYFISKLDLSTKTIKSSKLTIKKTGSEKLLEICRKLDATTYLSGELGKNYLNEQIFHDSKIQVIYEKFEHPTYHQLNKTFIPNMSILDLLFNEGPNAITILKNSKNF